MASEIRNCVVCGKPFLAAGLSFSAKKTCSLECSVQWRREQDNTRRKEQRRLQRMELHKPAPPKTTDPLQLRLISGQLPYDYCQSCCYWRYISSSGSTAVSSKCCHFNLDTHRMRERNDTECFSYTEK